MVIQDPSSPPKGNCHCHADTRELETWEQRCQTGLLEGKIKEKKLCGQRSGQWAEGKRRHGENAGGEFEGEERRAGGRDVQKGRGEGRKMELG